MFNNTIEDEYGAPGCKNIILFLTDGDITEGAGEDNHDIHWLKILLLNFNLYFLEKLKIWMNKQVQMLLCLPMD